jgi:uncharacterized protein
MKEKYSRTGYIKLWIENSPNEKKLRAIQNTIENEKKLKETFDKIFCQLKTK